MLKKVSVMIKLIILSKDEDLLNTDDVDTDNRNTANPESNDGTAICKREMIVTRFINEINGDINGLGLSSCHVN